MSLAEAQVSESASLRVQVQVCSKTLLGNRAVQKLHSISNDAR